jgi:Zn-dependent metalloprotease
MAVDRHAGYRRRLTPPPLRGRRIVVSVLCLTAAAGGAGAATAPAELRAAAIARALAHIAAAPGMFFASPHDTFEVRDVIVDADGREHVRLDRRFRGLPVIGGDLVVHGHASGRLDGASQELRVTLDLATQATVSQEQAVTSAEPELGGEPRGDVRVQLVVYARDGAVRLAYEIVLEGVADDGTPIELHVIIDAHTGTALDRWDGIETDAGAAAAAPCTGDCNGMGSVDINELVLGVDIALGTQPIAVCAAFDCEHDGTVAISCLVQGVNNALGACPAGPNPTATPDPATPTATATAALPTGIGHGFFYGPVTLVTDVAGDTYVLSDPSRGSQNTSDMNGGSDGDGTMFADADNVWGDGTAASRQSVAVDAQYGMAMTWDYYRVAHGRDGIANDGIGALNRVHYESEYNNAFWSDACFCMTYGDGDGVTFYPFVALDVTGHEMTHGITSHTAALVYSRESGALNEATSDIFGTAVEFYADDGNDPPDYLIGEKLYISGSAALRYMYRPSKDGTSADCWSDRVGRLNVHYSSGVANHFFYLLAEGSGVGSYTDATGATTCNGASLTGIGLAAAARIWYRALTVYLTSTATYASARVATLQSAADLFGAGSTERAAVAAAWSAVSVDQP